MYKRQPKHHVDKCYFAKTDLPIPADAVKKFEEGIDLGDFTSMPAKLEIIGDCEAKVIVQEGKFHQVKRMFEAVGVTVVYLKRLSMGSLKMCIRDRGCIMSLSKRSYGTN